MSKRSSITGNSQRAADGASAVAESFVNGLTRVVLNIPTASEVVINPAHMSVCVKVGLSQFEWYRDNNLFITVSWDNILWEVFLFLKIFYLTEDKNMKKIISLILAAILACSALFALVGCEPDSGAKETNGHETDNETEATNSEKLKIGIIQYMSHPSLDNCTNGIKAAFEESGLNYEISVKIGSANSADSDCVNFAKSMSTSCDIIFAVATPAAKAAFAATENTDVPVIFCAVSDPVEAKLVDSLDNPGALCTGTSDVLDLSAQLDLIQKMQPSVKKIGILYTSSEDNSISNLRTFQALCDNRNIEVVAKAVQSATDIPSAANELASQVDCINNFTDNNVVNNLSVVLSAADTYNIPVYGSEVEQVKNGCLAAVSIDYYALGKVTGEMGISVLNGADASKMAVRTISDATPVINTEVLAALGITMPSDYTDAETVVTND